MALWGSALLRYASAVPESGTPGDVAARRAAVGRRIRELRRNAGMTQEAVARAAGMSRPFYAGVEAGTRNVSLGNLISIADALSVPLAALFE